MSEVEVIGDDVTEISGGHFCSEADEIYRLTDMINYVLAVVGLTGNTLSIVVFLSTSLRTKEYSPLMVGLNISDICYLLVHTIVTVILYRAHVFQYGEFNPKLDAFRTYAETVTGTISLFYVLLFTLQRFLMFRYPHHKVTKNYIKRRKAIAFSMPVIMCLVYLLVLIDQDFIDLLKVIFVVLFRGIPGLVVVVINFMMVWTFKRQSRVRISLNEDNSSTLDQVTSAYDKANRMLYIISATFILFNAPFAIMYMYSNSEGFDFPCRIHGQQKAPVYMNIGYMICCLVFDFNFAINFFLYCLSGNVFRKAVTSLFIRVAPDRLTSIHGRSHASSEQRKSVLEARIDPAGKIQTTRVAEDRSSTYV